MRWRKTTTPLQDLKGIDLSGLRQRANNAPGTTREKFDRKWIYSGVSSCKIWTACRTPNGYGQMWTGDKLQLAHRVAWQLENGDIPEGLLCLHRCDTRECVNYRHLFLGTAQDNSTDMVRKGRCRPGVFKGEAHGGAKLTEAIVREIRSSDESPAVLAARYGVTPNHVSGIVRRRTWVHVI